MKNKKLITPEDLALIKGNLVEELKKEFGDNVIEDIEDLDDIFRTPLDLEEE